jgi:uncharacterized protein YkwD
MATQPSAQEQLMLELINKGRANPTAEAANFQIDLNEGVSTNQTISTTAKQPLAFNLSLVDAARSHSQWMLQNNQFSHTGANGSQPQDRMKAAGYQFTGSWASGENIAYDGTTGNLDVNSAIVQEYKDLFVDAGIQGRGHRLNLMNDNYREIGVGIQTGKFTSSNLSLNVAMTTQDFAKSGTLPFLTGVAYQDFDSNKFYTPGEGLSGLNISLQGTSGNFTTTTMGSGGYQIQVPAGTYTVTFSGGALTSPQQSQVTIASNNVKVDLIEDKSGTPQVVGGTPITGNTGNTGTGNTGNTGTGNTGNTGTGNTGNTNNNFPIVAVTKPTANAVDPGTSSSQSPSTIIGEYYTLSDNSDNVSISNLPSTAQGKQILGLSGGDTIQGSDSNDTLFGMQGPDYLLGGGGIDSLLGGKGSDLLDGGVGNDFLRGDNDNDTLLGGDSNDLLRGGKGNDSLVGGNGDDQISGDRGSDFLTGGLGNDTFIVGGGDFGVTDVSQADVITDFQSGQDKIGIMNVTASTNLQLEGINLNINNAGGIASTAIKLNNQYIGIVQGVIPSSFTSNDFVSVAMQ